MPWWLPPRRQFASYALATAVLLCSAAAQDSDAELPLALTAADAAYPGAVEPAAIVDDVTADASLELQAAIEPELPRAASPEDVAAIEEGAAEVSPMPRRFRYAISVDVRGVADDNVTLSNENKRQDIYFVLAPKVILGFGDVLQREENYIAVNYAPSGYLFTENPEFNTVEHIGQFEGQWKLGRLALIFRQEVESVQSANLDVPTATGGISNQINLDVGGRRRLTTFTSSVDAEYNLSGKTSLGAGIDWRLADYEQLIDSTTLAGSLSLNYKYSQKLALGLTYRAGENQVEGPSPDRVFQQIQVRTKYDLTGKLRMNGAVGMEFRQSEDRTRDQTSPIFRLGATYAAFDGTEFSLNATRRILNSASEVARDFTSTQVVLNARQRFFQRVFLDLTAGFQIQSYFSTFSGVRVEREDDYYFIAPGISVNITRFWSTGVYYLHRRNDSSVDFNSFRNNQFGLRTSLKF